MEALIKITQNAQGNNIVSARDVHGFVESAERFSKWFDRMKEYGFELNKDYTPYFLVHPSNNQQIDDYALTLDCAKEISMLQRNEKGKQARQYFIKVEEQYKADLLNGVNHNREIINRYIDLQEKYIALLERNNKQVKQINAQITTQKQDLEGQKLILSKIKPSFEYHKDGTKNEKCHLVTPTFLFKTFFEHSFKNIVIFGKTMAELDFTFKQKREKYTRSPKKHYFVEYVK